MRRTTRAVAGAAVVVALGLLLAPLDAGASSTAPAAPAQVAEAVPTIRLVTQPIAVEPNAPFPVIVAVDGAPEALEVAVDVYSRAAPGEVIGPEPERDPLATFPVVPLSEPDGDGARSAGFTIDVYDGTGATPDPAWRQRIEEPGVYPVRVRVRDGEGDVGVELMTAILRLPGAGQTWATATTALLVPVHRAPPADADRRASTATSGADEDLVDELEPVLDALEERADLPATFAVTPDTLARLAADEGAASTLGRLRDELEADRRTLLGAPYVDIDAASLVENDLADELDSQRAAGQRTLEQLLEPPISSAWQLQDRIDAATAEELSIRGITQLVLPGDAFDGGVGTAAPIDVATGSTPVRATVASEAYALGPDAPGDPVLAAHRLLARLAVTGTDLPADGGAHVIAEIDPAQVDDASLAILFDALLLGTPFATAGTVEQVLDAPAGSPATLAPRVPPDLGRYPVTLRRSRARLASYESMVGGRTELVAPYELPLIVSAARDLPLDDRNDDAASVAVALDEPFTAITVPAPRQITLGARDARFPLAIESDLDYPVQVVIELESSDRLEFPNNRIEQTLEPGRTVLQVEVRTRAPGGTPVRIRVTSPDDGVLLAETRWTIRSTAVSGVGIVLTVGAAAFLALWWGRHWHRSKDEARHVRRRRGRTRPSDEPEADDGV